MKSFLSLPWALIIDIARYVFILLDVVLLGLLWYAVRESRRLRPPLTPPTPVERRFALKNSSEFSDRWKVIMKKASASPESATLAVIEADNLTDDVLRRIGLAGETMADRLNQLDPQEITTLDRLWRVHRIRNAIVHRPGFSIEPNDAREMLGTYEAFLRDLEVLES